MNENAFENFVQDHGKDILRFCRMSVGNKEGGNELYQDTMLKLLEKHKSIDWDGNVKSYAMSVAILLWKNKKKKYAIRNRIAPMSSMDEIREYSGDTVDNYETDSVEEKVIDAIQAAEIRQCVAELPEKYRLPIYLYYSSDMKLEEIAKCMHLPLGTIKSRMRKSKELLKRKLEDMGYDG